MPDCVYEQQADDRYVCRQCGDVRTRPVRRNCRRKGARGVGDTIARALASLGFTKTENCQCDQRQAALNRLLPYSPAAWRARTRAVIAAAADLPAWLIGANRRPPRVLQIAPTLGAACGIANFAQNLHDAASCENLPIETHLAAPAELAGYDVALIQHERSFYCRSPRVLERQARRLEAAGIRRVAFIHSATNLDHMVDAYLTMAPGMVETEKPVHTIDLPAYSAPPIDRQAARREVGLAAYDLIVGAHGFLTPARRFDAIVRRLAPAAAARNGALILAVSTHAKAGPAHQAATDRLITEALRWPNVYIAHGFHARETINALMQLCDLAVCWTDVESRPYGSAVASDLYGTGVRLIAADKIQHRAVIGRPNVVAAPEGLADFLDVVVAEMAAGPPWPRHDPTPLSWPAAIVPLFDFLRKA